MQNEPASAAKRSSARLLFKLGVAVAHAACASSPSSAAQSVGRVPTEPSPPTYAIVSAGTILHAGPDEGSEVIGVLPASCLDQPRACPWVGKVLEERARRVRVQLDDVGPREGHCVWAAPFLELFSLSVWVSREDLMQVVSARHVHAAEGASIELHPGVPVEHVDERGVLVSIAGVEVWLPTDGAVVPVGTTYVPEPIDWIEWSHSFRASAFLSELLPSTSGVSRSRGPLVSAERRDGTISVGSVCLTGRVADHGSPLGPIAGWGEGALRARSIGRCWVGEGVDVLSPSGVQIGETRRWTPVNGEPEPRGEVRCVEEAVWTHGPRDVRLCFREEDLRCQPLSSG